MSGTGPHLRDDVEADLDAALDLDSAGAAGAVGAVGAVSGTGHGWGRGRLDGRPAAGQPWGASPEEPDPDAGEPAAPGPAGAAGGGGARSRLRRWPDTAPGWVRGPGAVLGAALLAAALVGGMISHQAGARVEQQVAERTALLSLAVGSVELEGVLTGGPVSVRGADGGADTGLVVTLVNRGERAVQAQLTGLHVPDRVGSEDVEPVEVAPDATALVRLPLDVDCADVPEPVSGGSTDPSARSLEWLTVRTGEPGGALSGPDARLPITQPRFTVSDQLAWACEPSGPEAVTGSAMELRDDGRLLVRVENSSSQPMLVIPQEAPGTDLVSEPPLPVRLRAGEAEVLALGLGVDCSRVGDVLGLVYGSTVDLLASADDDDPTVDDGGYSVMGEPAISAWAAGTVGAACGVRPAP